MAARLASRAGWRSAFNSGQQRYYRNTGMDFFADDRVAFYDVADVTGLQAAISRVE